MAEKTNSGLTLKAQKLRQNRVRQQRTQSKRTAGGKQALETET